MKRQGTGHVWVLTRKERWGEDDVPHPALAVDLRVEAAGYISWHTAGQSVQHDGSRVDGAVVVHVEHSQQRHDDDSCRDEKLSKPSDARLRKQAWSVQITVPDTVPEFPKPQSAMLKAHLFQEWGTEPPLPTRHKAGFCKGGTWRRQCVWSSSHCLLGPGHHSHPPLPHCICRIKKRTHLAELKLKLRLKKFGDNSGLLVKKKKRRRKYVQINEKRSIHNALHTSSYKILKTMNLDVKSLCLHIYAF